MSAPLPVYLDLAKADVGPEGIAQFLWPLAPQEVIDVRDAFFPLFIKMTKEAAKRDARGAEGLMILSTYIASELLTIYQGAAILERFNARGMSPVLPEHYRVWPALAEGRVPALPPVFSTLCNSFPPRTISDILAKPGKALSKILQKNQTAAAPQEKAKEQSHKPSNPIPKIPSARLGAKVIRNSIICTKRGDILALHGQESDRLLVMCRHKDWFGPLRQKTVKKAMDDSLEPALENDLLALTRDSIAAGNYKIPQWLLEHFRTIYRTSAAVIGLHMKKLRARKNTIPAILWSGSGGNLWDRMLRTVVRERKGHCTVHAHALGSGYKVFKWDPTNEFFECDEYCSYNQTQSELARKQIDKNLLFQETIPIFSAITTPAREVKDFQGATSSAIKRIMYMDTGYDGEKVQLHQGLADTPLADWQARLFFWLGAQGFLVTHKFHPDFPPPALRQLQAMGITPEGRRFEQVLNETDMFIFDNVATTVFNVALTTNLPIVLVDFNFYGWDPEAVVALKKRCAFVTGTIDANNRASVQWNELHEAIRSAPGLAVNKEFVQRYLF